MAASDRSDGQDEVQNKPVLALSLSTAKIWTLGGICATVLVGAVGLGTWTEKTNSSSVTAKKDQEIRELTDKLGDAQRGVDALKGALKETMSARKSLETKNELLTRLAGYLQGRDEVSKRLLINAVCSMWRESETRVLKLQTEPITLKNEDFDRGLRPEVETFLKSNGVSSDVLNLIRKPLPPQRISVGPLTSRNPEYTERQREFDNAKARVWKQASQVRVIKVVIFEDGSRYEMPQEIALAVHIDPNCAPL